MSKLVLDRTTPVLTNTEYQLSSTRGNFFLNLLCKTMPLPANGCTGGFKKGPFRLGAQQLTTRTTEGRKKDKDTYKKACSKRGKESMSNITITHFLQIQTSVFRRACLVTSGSRSNILREANIRTRRRRPKTRQRRNTDRNGS